MSSKTLLPLAATLAAATLNPRQSLNHTTSATTTINGSVPAAPSGYGTPTAAYTTALSLDLDDYWNLLVGPVSSANITTTVSPTPVPASSLIPPPPLHYPAFLTGQQNPLQVKNESWSFPKGFFWGVAGAAFQIEGAVKAEGRGPSIWDVFAHRVQDYVLNNDTADISDNNYYMYKEDIARIAALGVQVYSLSISWSRIMPYGHGAVNQQGIDHYNDVINTCLQYNVTPLVTLYHWDLPLALQNDYDGWNSERIIDDFVEYARVVYDAFGDRVKTWFTINEPIEVCAIDPVPSGYFRNFSVPAQQAPFFCGQNILLAHSRAYHLGKSMMPNASISYKNNGGYKIPQTNSSADAAAVQRAWDFNEGWFSEPVYLTGEYPASVKEYVSTFLRPFTAEEKRSINGSADFYAHDAYTAQFFSAPPGGVNACVSNTTHPLYPQCYASSYTYSAEDGGWLVGPAAEPLSPWLHRATDWVPAFLHYIADTWAKDNMPIAVTEFGFAEPFEAQKKILADILYDPIRTSYFHDYLRGTLMALSEGVNLIGCTAWSLYDNFEWATGYSSHFGLQYVNMSDPALPRYYKASFFEYKNTFDIYQEK